MKTELKSTSAGTDKCILYDYPKSSASYRVRIALNLANIEYERQVINLLDGANKSPDHLKRNPQGLVPVLDIDGHSFTQSLAIIEYLNATRGLNLLPAAPEERALILALAHMIAMDIHPVCNLSVIRYATGLKEPERTDWMQNFIRPGLLAFETQLAAFEQRPFCVGEHPTLPDLCLIPQLYNAQRWHADYGDCPRIAAVEEACRELEAFSKAHPDK